MLYSHDQLYKHIWMQNHNDSSLEKYTSHFIWKGSKGLLNVLLCERWVGGWTELQHIDPHSYGHNSVSFPFSWAAQPGAWGPSLSGTCSSFQHLLSNWSDLQRTDFLSSPGLYNCSISTLLAASVTISHSIQPVHCQGYILIFLDRMHLLFTQVHFLFWQPGRGQYVTERNYFKSISGVVAFILF